jgi:hypothetical protein
MVLNSLLYNRLVVQMKERSFYKTTPLGKEKSDSFKKSILIEYPDEDLYEDGELSDETFLLSDISEVELKIIRLWRQNKIVIARWEDLNG